MLDLLLSHFVTLFVVVDPIGISVIFSGLAQGNAAARRTMAVRATLLSTMILLVFFFAGEWLIRVLGIGQSAFRIAGGVLLFLLAIDMVFARQSGLRSTTFREQEEAALKEDISVFPLAFPLIAGPGALTTVLLMAGSSKEVFVVGAMVATILVIMAATLAALLVATRISALLGQTGANVISRLLGLILAALAVQYVIDGLMGVALG